MLRNLDICILPFRVMHMIELIARRRQTTILCLFID